MEKSIFDCARQIENEFQEPLRDVVAGFIPLGMTRVEVAETLEVDPRSLRTYCERTGISFPRNQPDRRERISEGRRRGRGVRVLKLDGRQMCLTGWAEFAGIKPNTLRMRLARGKTLRAALSE